MVVCKGGGAMMPDRELSLEGIQDHLARYAFAAEFVSGKSVLDVACGSGYGSSYLFDKGARVVIGGDISAEAIEIAGMSYRRPGGGFVLLDATRLPFADNSFEVIVSMETIEHLEQYERYLGECKRVLKGGGIFICSTPNRGHGIPEITSFGPDHVHEFYLEEFQGLLSGTFTETQFYAQGYWNRMERTKVRARLKIERAVKPFILSIPKLYRVLKFLDMRFIRRMPSMQLSQMEDFDSLLNGAQKPLPLNNGSLAPRTIIAVARK